MSDPHIDRLREFIGAWHRDTVDVMEAESALDALAADLDAANKLLHGLTNEADANGAWKALILRAERAERERDAAIRERDEARRDWQQYVHEVKDEAARADAAEARVAELETALREIAEGKVKPAKAGRGEWARTSLVLGMQLRARAALAADAADTEEPDTPPRTIEQMAESLDKWTEPADTEEEQ